MATVVDSRIISFKDVHGNKRVFFKNIFKNNIFKDFYSDIPVYNDLHGTREDI